jgi:hypothetical protein
MEQDINNKLIRCPRLGDEMTFAYCLQEAGELPCARIVHCWSPVFNVEPFLREKMPPEKWEKFTSLPPGDKVVSLIDMIEKAKRLK